MSFSDEMAEFRRKRQGNTANQAGGSQPSATLQSQNLDNGDFASQMRQYRQQRSNMTIAERVEQRVQNIGQNQMIRTQKDAFDNTVHNALAGQNTASSYYSLPALGSQSEELYSRMEGINKSMAEKLTPLNAARTAQAQAEKDLLTVKEYLDQVKAMYDSDPTAENASRYNQIIDKYNRQYQTYRDAYDAYNAAYQAYKPYEDDLVNALVAYRLYSDQQQKLYGDWRATVRDAGSIQAEIDTITAQLDELRAADQKGNRAAAWGNFKEQVAAAVAGTTAQDPYGYNANGEKIQELVAARELLQEELDWSKHFYYTGMMDAGDFGEKSQYVSKPSDNRDFLTGVQEFLGIYSDEESGWEDPLYEAINGNEAASNWLANRAARGYTGPDNNLILNLYHGAADSREESQQMTEDEVKIFNYLYATQGKDAAHSYYSYLQSDLNRREREAVTAQWKEYADTHPIASSVFSVAASPLKGISYLGQAMDYLDDARIVDGELLGGTIDENAGYNKFSYIPAAIREEVPKNWGPVGSFAYQTGMSMADFLMTAAVSGGNQAVSLAIMGSGAAADTTIAAKDRGLTDDQAFVLGTVAGFAEIITEKVSLDALLDGKLLRDGSLKYIFKNIVAEGGEEVGSDLINLFADILVSKDQSEWEMSIAGYTAQGMSEEEAFGKALGEQAMNLGLDFLGGAISGGVMSGVRAGFSNITTNRLAKEMGKLGLNQADIQQFINTALEGEAKSEAYQLAQKLQEKIGNGGTVTDMEAARLVRAGEMDLTQWAQSKMAENAQFRAQEEAWEQDAGAQETQLQQAAGDGQSLSQRAADRADSQTFGTQKNQVAGTRQAQTDAPVSLAQQLRQEQNMIGGTENGNEQQATDYAAEKTGNDLLDGSSQRYAGTGAGEQAGGVAKSTALRQARANRGREIVEIQNIGRSLRLQRVSTSELGLETGTQAKTVQVFPQTHWTIQMQETAERIKTETGRNVTYVLGRMQVKGAGGRVSTARGVISGEEIFIQADNTKLTIDQIADHEAYHARVADDGEWINDTIREHIVETYSREELDAVLDKYIEGLQGVIDVGNAQNGEEYEAAMRYIMEELLADAYAGINAFDAHAERFTQTVNEKMTQIGKGKQTAQENGTRQTNGPNDDVQMPGSERYSLEEKEAESKEPESITEALERQWLGEYYDDVMAERAQQQAKQEQAAQEEPLDFWDEVRRQLRQNLGIAEESGAAYEGRSLTEDPEIYAYDFLTSQPDMLAVKVPALDTVRDENGRVKQGKAVAEGMKNARSVGTEQAGIVLVENRYTGRPLRVNTNTIRHSLGGDQNRLYTNARLACVAGEIIQNALPVNSLNNTASGVIGTYAMASYAVGEDGREYVAIITVEQNADSVESIAAYDVAHAISGRQKNRSKQADSKSPQSINSSMLASKISIADFLSVVNNTYQSILSDDVLNALGERRNPDGYYSNRVRYSLDEDSGLEASEDEQEFVKRMIERNKEALQQEFEKRRIEKNKETLQLEYDEAVEREEAGASAIAQQGTRDMFPAPANYNQFEQTLPEDYDTTMRRMAAEGASEAIRDRKKAEAKREAERKTTEEARREARSKSAQQMRDRAKAIKQEIKKELVKAGKPYYESKPTIAKKELRTTVIRMFSIPEGSKAELGKILDDAADRLIKNGRITWSDQKNLLNRLYESGVMTVAADEYFADARNYMRHGKIYVSESVREELGAEWNDLRRRFFAAGMYLVTDKGKGASGIDAWNADLAEMYPGLFDAEDTDMTGILYRIIQVAEEGRDEKMSLPEYASWLEGNHQTTEDEYLEGLEKQFSWALKTFAEKARLEIELRDREGMIVAREREKATEARYMDAYREQVRKAKERERRRETNERIRARKELKAQQEKTLKVLQWLKKNRNRAPEDLKAAFDEVLSDLDLYAVVAANELRWSDKYEATWQDLATMYKDARANDPNFMPSKDLEKIMDRVDGRKLEDLDIDALQNLYRAAVGLQTELRNRSKVLGEETESLFAEVYADSKQEIKGAKGKYKGTFIDKLMNQEQLSAINMIERMSGWNPNGVFYSMGKQLEQGEKNVRAYKVKANRMMVDFLNAHEDWAKRADGQGKDGIWYTVKIPELVGALEVGKKPKFGDEIEVSFTAAQKVHMYLESKSYDNLRHMEGGRTFADKELYQKGKRKEAFAMGKTVKLAPETVKALVADMTQEELELARVLEQYYNTLAPQEINRVSNILVGFDKAMGGSYAPIFTNENYNKTEFGVFDVTAEGVGNLKERVHSKNPSYNISALDAFERNVDQTARYVGMAIPTRNWTSLMNWRESGNSMEDVITHKWGPEATEYLEKLITDLQGGKPTDSDLISDTVERIKSNYISAIFGTNPSIVLKQVGSIPLASAYLGTTNFPNPVQIKKIDRSLIAKYSQDLDWRTMGYSMPETKQLKDNPNWTQTNKVVHTVFGGGGITAMDGWAASILWPWAENKVKKENPNLEVGTKEQIEKGESPFYKKVAEEFENAVARSQSTSDEMHQGTLRKSKNPFAQAFTMFRSDSAQTYNVFRQKLGEAAYYKRTGDKQGLGKTQKAIGSAVLATLSGYLWAETVNFLMNLWKHAGKKYRDDEEELTAGSVLEEIGTGILYDIAGIVTGGEEIAQVIGAIFTDDKWYDIEIMGMETINDMLSSAVDTAEGMFEIMAGAANIIENDGDLGQYFAENSGEILGTIKELAQNLATYGAGLSVTNLEAYLLGTFKYLSPELAARYEDLFQEVGKPDLSGMKGDALEYRLGEILGDRNVTEDDATVAALAALYQEGYKGAVPSDIPSSITVSGESRKLEAYQQQAYGNIWSSIVADGLDELVASEVFEIADAELQEKMLKKLYAYAAEQAKAVLFDEYALSASAEEIEQSIIGGASTAECIIQYAMPSHYGQFVGNGISPEEAYELAGQLGDLEPEEDEDSVSDVQQMRACITFYADEDYQLAALATVLSESQMQKVDMAHDYGVKPEMYVSYYEIRENFDADQNGSLNQTEVKAALDSMEGLTNAQRAALWQVANKSWKAAKNPYDTAVGQKIVDSWE